MRKTDRLQTTAPLFTRRRDDKPYDVRFFISSDVQGQAERVCGAGYVLDRVDETLRLQLHELAPAGVVVEVVGTRARGRNTLGGKGGREAFAVARLPNGALIYFSKTDPRFVLVPKAKKSKAVGTVCGFCFGPMTSPAASDRCLQPQLHASAEAPAVAVVGDFCEGPCPYCETGRGECVAVMKARI